MVLRDNFFVEQIVPNAVLRTLSDEEMAEYRRPFAEPGEGRRPTPTWVRQIPIDGEPDDVAAIAAGYADWLATSGVPKLFVRGRPRCDPRRWRQSRLRPRVASAGRGDGRRVHFLQEDSPDEIRGPSPTGSGHWADGMADRQNDVKHGVVVGGVDTHGERLTTSRSSTKWAAAVGGPGARGDF
jgi:hypothetical protein